MLVVSLWIGFQTFIAITSYRSISADARVLRGYEQRELASLSVADMQTIQSHLADMHLGFQRIDRATSVPLIGGVVEELPWVGSRYESGRALVDVGLLLSGAGADATQTGTRALNAFDRTEFSRPEDGSDNQTWLDIVRRDHDALMRSASNVTEARAIRASMDTSVLPSRVQAQVDDLDRIFERFDFETLAAQTLPAVEAGLGADGPVRYWVLFPNPAELRPAGGFPGTGALVTFESGQIASYEFYDMKKVSDDYLAKRTEVLPAPMPIDRYLFDGGFLPHDVVWWSDHTLLGADFMQMYEVIGYPEISGVITVQPTIVADLLRVTGDVTVDVDGEQRVITPDNVFIEMERQRAQRRAGDEIDASHKDVIALVGNEILTQLKEGSRQQLQPVAEYMRAGANRRDIQAYSTNSDIMRLLDERGWSGRTNVATDAPTLAVTFANLVATKASLTMFPDATLRFGPVVNGQREATLEITLSHEGTNDIDAYYGGFQRWWTQVDLPDGSRVLSTSDDPQPDPDAPDGGAYLFDIFPQQSETFSVTFEMPDSDVLHFRRQPGVNAVDLAVEAEGCTAFESVKVNDDIAIDLAGHCD